MMECGYERQMEILYGPSPFDLLLDHLDIPNDIPATIGMLVILFILTYMLDQYYKRHLNKKYGED